MHRDLILLAGPLPPRLLPNHPYSRARPRGHFRRCLRNHEFQPGHRLQESFHSFPCLDYLEHGGVEVCLGDDDGVVGGGIEELGGCEVVQDGVRVDAHHLGRELGCGPALFIEGFFGHCGGLVLNGGGIELFARDIDPCANRGLTRWNTKKKKHATKNPRISHAWKMRLLRCQRKIWMEIPN